MSALTSQASTHASTSGRAPRASSRRLAGALLTVLLAAAAAAQERPSPQPAPDGSPSTPLPEQARVGGEPEPPEANAEGEPLFTLGPLEYRVARGLRFGDSGLTLGGFATAELERPDHQATSIALDSVNLIALYEPVESLRAFAELEVGGLFSWESRGGGTDSDAKANFERLYAEYDVSDALTLRFGKFQTPVGRWNLAPEEPFTWTATSPAIVERGFDEHQTGIEIHGSFYPARRVVSYWLYGQVLGAFDEERDSDNVDRSVGGRVEYGEARGAWSLGASLLGSKKDGRWATTAGVDAKVRAGRRLELSSELLASGGDIPERRYWGVFVEAAYPLDQLSPKLAQLYLVGRFEHFDAHGERATQLFDLGLTWLPRDWLNVKVGYRAATRNLPDSFDELKIAASVLF